MMAPPKKSKTGLIILIVVILVVLIGGGVAAAVALGGKKGSPTTGNSNTPTTSTPTPGVTPSPTTPSIPSGFQQFSNSNFSVIYPSAWTAKSDSSSNGGEDFTSTTGQLFQVLIEPTGTQDEIPTYLDTLCSIFGTKIGSVTTVTIGGQQWQQETCGDNGTPDGTVEAVIYKGQLYSIDYASLAGGFTTDQTQYYTPMEQSFKFNS